MSARHEAELRALRDALATPKPAPARGASVGDAPLREPTKDESELVAALRELKDGLLDAAQNADEIIVTHPVASVGASFLLGLAVGRLLRGL